jgi:hypothetical protein
MVQKKKTNIKGQGKVSTVNEVQYSFAWVMRKVLAFPVTRQTKQNFYLKSRLMDSLREYLIYSELFSLA